MNLNFDISPEAEANLRERASQSGVSPQEYARRFVEQGLGNAATNGSSKNGVHSTAKKSVFDEPGDLSDAEAQRQLRGLQEWFDGRKDRPHLADDSRDSIYEGRGE